MPLNILSIVGLIIGELFALLSIFNSVKLKKRIQVLITSVVSFVCAYLLFFFSLREFFILIFSLSFGIIFTIKALFLHNSTLPNTLASFFFFAFATLSADNTFFYIILAIYLSAVLIIVIIGKFFVSDIGQDIAIINVKTGIVRFIAFGIFFTALILLSFVHPGAQSFEMGILHETETGIQYLIFDAILFTGTIIIIVFTLLSSVKTNETAGIEEMSAND